jgi:hypothetical protein
MVEGGFQRPLREPSARAPRRHVRWLVALALGAALVVVTGCGYPSSARPACADAILDAWTRGALADTYPADCYDDAIDALPEDLRAYTTAADDISRAAIAAGRADAPTRRLASSPVADESARAFPAAVVLLAALVAAITTSGLTASVIRRRRGR